LCLSSGLLGTTPVVFSGGFDGAVRMWSVSSVALRLISTLEPEEGAIFSLAAAALPDGTCLLAAGSYSRRLSLWRLRPQAVGELPPLPVRSAFLHTGWVRALALATARRGAQRPCRVYSIGCNRIVGWGLHGAWVGSGAATAAAAPMSELAVFEDGEERVRSHDILCLAHGGDEEMLASGSIDGALRVWSTRELASSGELAPTPPAWWIGHGGERVAALAFHRGSLLSCGYDGWVRRWRPSLGRPPESGEGGAVRWELEAEVEPVASVAEAADTARLTSLVVARCADGSAADLVHVGSVSGQVVSLDAEHLGHVRRWQLPPLAETTLGFNPSADVRVTALSAVPAAQARGGSDEECFAAVVVCGDSAGRLHIVYS